MRLKPVPTNGVPSLHRHHSFSILAAAASVTSPSHEPGLFRSSCRPFLGCFKFYFLSFPPQLSFSTRPSLNTRETHPSADSLSSSTPHLDIMEAPPSRYREPPGLPAPSIYIETSSSTSASGRYRSSEQPDSYGAYSSSVARSIPGAPDPNDAVPPPLPPPRYFPVDNPAHPVDREEPAYYNPFLHREPSSFSPRTHGTVGSIGGFMDERPNYKRRESGSFVPGKPERDEGYASISSAGSMRSDNSLPGLAAGFGHLHNHFQLESGADAFLAMKRKLDPLKTLDNRPSPARSLLSASVNETLSRRPSQDPRQPAALSMPTNLPLHIKANMSIPVLDSPDRFTSTPIHSALSPSHHQPFGVHNGAIGEYRSTAMVDLERSPPMRTRRTNSDDASTQASYEPGEDMEMEESSMKRLHIDDAGRSEMQTAGMKRRASSPPGDDQKLPGISMQGDMLRRRDVNSRGSPAPRLSTIPQGSTPAISTTSRSSSFNSGGLSLVTGLSGMNSSMSSSYNRLSPGGTSPGGISPIPTDPGCSSPYSAPISLNPSPRGSLSRAPHQRNISDGRPIASPRKPTSEHKANGSKIQGYFMCECCPKKPKKFETAEELGAHEAEKQYECSYCGNRFKNKNEMERHQNSLHVRRHSWSCSALTTYDRAFHDSTNRPGEADTCGYCGEEFPRSGRGSGASAPRLVTDQNLEERVRHLQEMHKFRECNSNKKFYRADHFRQHLKHSHAGTSGKWTNMLENACMMEEDPTPR